MDFQDKVQTLINECSLENESDTPDYILAQYLMDCLDIFEKAVRARDGWHSFVPSVQHYEYGQYCDNCWGVSGHPYFKLDIDKKHKPTEIDIKNKLCCACEHFRNKNYGEEY